MNVLIKIYTWLAGILCHLGLLVLLTSGVIPSLNKFRDFETLTILKMTLWSERTLSTVKLNQNLNLGLQVSGLMKRSYSNSEMSSTRPRLPVSNEASKQRWPFFALPLWPGGRITSLFTLPNPPSVSLSSLSKHEKKLVIFNWNNQIYWKSRETNLF